MGTRVQPRVVRVARSLGFLECWYSFCLFSLENSFVCLSIYEFWLPLWYPQAILTLQKCWYSDIGLMAYTIWKGDLMGLYALQNVLQANII